LISVWPVMLVELLGAQRLRQRQRQKDRRRVPRPSAADQIPSDGSLATKKHVQIFLC
jgi:hypothetical protein